MKNGLLSCSVLALLFVPACGDKPAPVAPAPLAPAPAAKQPEAPAPAQTPTPAPAPVAGTTEPKTQQPATAPKKPGPPVRIDYDSVKRFFRMEPFAQPTENTPTSEKVALGKILFHDKQLSKNGDLSCASCHDLATYGQDGKAHSPGSDGKHSERNTPTVWNAARQFAQFWDARAATVEEQVLVHVLDPFGLAIADEAQLVTKLKGKPELAAEFGKAFPGSADAVTAQNYALAIGAFERTLVTKSKFDAYLDGDQKALSNEEKQGLKYFIDFGCIQCHLTRLVGAGMFQKIGVLKPYPTEDLGRAKVTGSDADKHIFKVAMLSNIEKTAPYFHDGKIATLDEAVTTMARIQLDKTLKPEETAALVAFLKALTGPLPELK